MSGHDLEDRKLLAVAIADVHEDHTRQANLYHLATHDPLTGLLNRSYFVEAADQALRRSERHARHVGMVFVDLDDFKRVNDLGGHALGDRVLYAVGARLRHTVRSADLVARIGGDEFAVLCEDLVAAEQAQVVAQRIAAALAESVELDGQSWTVAASVGAAVDEGVPDSAEHLLDRADRAMYEIKSNRRTEPVSSIEAPSSAESMAPPSEPPVERRQVPVPESVPDPAGEAAQHLVSDILALRDSLDAIRERLGRLSGGDSAVIDIRDRQDVGDHPE
jgi:diguanylate cyclase (GGDEF)-like protein